MKFSADFLINLGLLVLAIFFLSLVSDYPKEARLFPRLVLVVMIILIFFDIVVRTRTMLKSKSLPTNNKETVKPACQKTFRFLLTIGLMAVFMYVIQIFGFTLGTFVFISLSVWALGYRNLKYLTVSSVVITGFMYIVFILVMDSFLPQGLLFDLLRN